jgi:hypothetical protein
MLSWFSTTLRFYGQSRYTSDGPWESFSLSPGLAFRPDWQSSFKFELVYTRHFFSDRADANSADPLDRNVISLGGQAEF